MKPIFERFFSGMLLLAVCALPLAAKADEIAIITVSGEDVPQQTFAGLHTLEEVYAALKMLGYVDHQTLKIPYNSMMKGNGQDQQRFANQMRAMYEPPADKKTGERKPPADVMVMALMAKDNTVAPHISWDERLFLRKQQLREGTFKPGQAPEPIYTNMVFISAHLPQVD